MAACSHCGAVLEPQQFPGGKRETPAALARRRYCSRQCAGAARRQTAPTPASDPTDWTPYRAGAWVGGLLRTGADWQEFWRGVRDVVEYGAAAGRTRPAPKRPKE